MSYLLSACPREQLLRLVSPPESPYARYQRDPLGYVRDVLGRRLWSTQEEAVRRLLEPPWRVAIRSCHKVGKSFLAACLICWHYDCFPDSLTITTAPTQEAVEKQLWREVRVLRAAAGLGGFRGATAPELWSGHDHWAVGFTASTGGAFQGRHARRMLFVIDEGVDVPAWVYDVILSMFKPGGEHFELLVGNPTDTASQMYAEELAVDREGNPAWTWLTMSAVDHPNIAAERRGEPPPFPAAVSLAQLEKWIEEWCDPIPADEATAEDLEWPPGSGHWYLCGPQMESRALGRWPSAGTLGVWSDALWQAAVTPRPFTPAPFTLPEVGCDVARFGDDFTEMHARWGGTSLHQERHNGWDTQRTAGRLAELCREFAERANAIIPTTAARFTPQAIPVKVDDSGVGGGVTDRLREGRYNVRAVNAAEAAVEADRYLRVRDELWFATALRARRGTLDLSRLPRDVLARLRQQAMAPLWKQDGAGRRVVEPKADTKKRLPQLGSPDGMDAVNLAYYAPPSQDPLSVPGERPGLAPRKGSRQEQRGLMGKQARQEGRR